MPYSNETDEIYTQNTLNSGSKDLNLPSEDFMTLMTTLNGLMKITLILNGVQAGTQLTSSLLLTELMLPTPQLLNVQFMLPAAKVQD